MRGVRGGGGGHKCALVQSMACYSRGVVPVRQPLVPIESPVQPAASFTTNTTTREVHCALTCVGSEGDKGEQANARWTDPAF